MSETDMSGITFLEALYKKYAEVGEINCGIFLVKNTPVPSDDGELTVPSQLSLYQSGISHVGDVATVTTLCRDVASLDLTCNLLSDWSEVLRLLRCMSKIHFLNLSNNHLDCPLVAEQDTTFPSITKLVLNSTFVSWATVSNLLRIMPSIQELHLCLNQHTTIDLDPRIQFPEVKTVYLNSNKIHDFREFLKLDSAFPSLEQLVMMENPITALPDPEVIKVKFSNLQYINIKQTLVPDWQQLEKFRHFPALSEMRLQQLPFLKEIEEKHRRQMTIGYLPNLTKINGSVVGANERVDAERAFIRHFMDRDERPPRYAELEARHGKLEPLVEVSLKPENIRTIKVTFEEKVKMRKINIKKTVKDLKRELVKEMTDLTVSQVRMYLSSDWRMSTELVYPEKFLYSYMIEDGEEILMQPKPKFTSLKNMRKSLKS